ncbi:MAG TPA: hypothetical protein PLO61_06090, partial [Fimbriimonadaceae bacterium]|nr:hypothetical protein [Fimbriimonadaceae bacterium]
MVLQNWMRFSLATLAGATAMTAFALGPKVIYSNVQASATSDVPGLGGVKFAGTATLPNNTQPFGRPAMTPDGTKFLIRADTDAATSIDDVLLLGDLSTSSVVVREGDVSPNGATFAGVFRADYRILNDGRYAFSADTTAATNSDEIAVRWNGTLLELIASEGTPIPGLSGVNFGTSNTDTQILDNGDLTFRTTGITGFSGREIIVRMTDPTTGSVLFDDATFVPAGQLQGGTPAGVTSLSSGRYRTSVTGANTIIHSFLASPVVSTQNEIMVQNGTVLFQEGFPIPGATNTANVNRFYTDTNSTWQSPDGSEYILRVELNDGAAAADRSDLIVKNGLVIASNGDAIPGAGVNWSDDSGFSVCFFFSAINDNGDTVVGGLTDATDPNANSYMVFNGNTVIMKEGDPIDLDGNGSYDDDAFISIFNNDDGILTNSRWLYQTVILRNGAGQSIGQAFIATDINALLSGSNVVTGTVDFGQLTAAYNTGANLPSSIPVSFRDAANTEIATGSATYNPVTGAFSATVPGSVTVPYRVSFKQGFWLRKTMPNPSGAATPLGNYNFGTVTPLVGDSDDDNEVTNFDYSLWAAANGNSVTANTDNDFDGDGEITNFDYSL